MKLPLAAFAAMSSRSWHRIYGAFLRHPILYAAVLPTLLAAYVLALVPTTPSVVDLQKAKLEHPTVVTTADGFELAEFRRTNREWLKLKDMSPHVVAALIATEDRRFYEHDGIDWRRTAVAAMRTLRGERQGGSTLTQQLARNLYPQEVGRAPTVSRKVKEAITALKIEAAYSKDEILETYLNTVPFLYNAHGIEMAARTYFDKGAGELDVLESATLIGMLKGTSYYNPVLNPTRAVQRRNIVLAQMVRHGHLPQAQLAALEKMPMKLDFERQTDSVGPAPHLAEHLRRWLIEWADRRGYDIHGDGLVVRTTIDSRLQAAANEAIQRQGDALQAVAAAEWSRAVTPFYSTPAGYARVRGVPFEHFWRANPDLERAFIRESSRYAALRGSGASDEQALQQLQSDAAFVKDLRHQKTRLQTGFVAMEPGTGHVKAWVGSRDFSEDKFDHVQQARRQPGSTFKPFVYGAAFEQGISPMEMLIDAPVEIRVDERTVWKPADVGQPSGLPMTLREGLVHSKNTITAQLVQRVGPSRVAGLARSMGVRESRLDEVPSLALGTSPVTLKEMVSGFSTIANGGNYVSPVVVTRIEDREGRTLELFLPPAPEAALSRAAALTLLDVLRGVISEGTGVGLRQRFRLGDSDLAGKTGTTQDNTDGWFIVMHPQIVAGAWVGFNDNRVRMRSDYWGQGAHNALLVAGDFMEQTLRSGNIDRKARFPDPQPPQALASQMPLFQRMNDWFGSVFQGTPEASVHPGAAVPPPSLAEAPPQVLQEAPSVEHQDAGGSAQQPADITPAAAPESASNPAESVRAPDDGMSGAPEVAVVRRSDSSRAVVTVPRPNPARTSPSGALEPRVLVIPHEESSAAGAAGLPQAAAQASPEAQGPPQRAAPQQEMSVDPAPAPPLDSAAGNPVVEPE